MSNPKESPTEETSRIASPEERAQLIQIAHPVALDQATLGALKNRVAAVVYWAQETLQETEKLRPELAQTGMPFTRELLSELERLCAI